jgi:hypothetical protein
MCPHQALAQGGIQGALEFADKCDACVNSCNVSDGDMTSVTANGIALSLVGNSGTIGSTNVTFMTVCNCKGNSILKQGSGRHVSYDRCNFVDNKGYLFSSAGGSVFVTACHFVRNFQTSGIASSGPGLFDGSAKIFLADSYFDVAPPSANALFVRVIGNHGPGTYETPMNIHMNTAMCPTAPPPLSTARVSASAIQSTLLRTATVKPSSPPATPVQTVTDSPVPTQSPAKTRTASVSKPFAASQTAIASSVFTASAYLGCELFSKQLFNTQRSPTTTNDCVTVRDCVFKDCVNSGGYGGGFGMPDSITKSVDINDTSFLNCKTTGGTNEYGGAVALSVQRLRMNRCCGKECSSQSGQFLWLSNSPNSTIGMTNCYLCASSAVSANEYGAFALDESTHAYVSLWNCTDCSLEGGSGAAVMLCKGQMGGSFCDFRFSAIVGCRGPSIVFEGRPDRPDSRTVYFTSCTFLTNHGTMFNWRQGSCRIRSCVFRDNMKFDVDTPLSLDEVFNQRGTSTCFYVSDSFMDFELPVINEKFNEATRNAGPSDFPTIALYFMHTEECPRGPTGKFTDSKIFSPSTRFIFTSPFTSTKQLSASGTFLSTTLFAQSSHISSSHQISPTNCFGNSVPLLSSVKIEETREGSKSDLLKCSRSFSVSMSLSKSIEHAKSDLIASIAGMTNSHSFCDSYRFIQSRRVLPTENAEKSFIVLHTAANNPTIKGAGSAAFAESDPISSNQFRLSNGLSRSFESAESAVFVPSTLILLSLFTESISIFETAKISTSVGFRDSESLLSAQFSRSVAIGFDPSDSAVKSNFPESVTVPISSEWGDSVLLQLSSFLFDNDRLQSITFSLSSQATGSVLFVRSAFDWASHVFDSAAVLLSGFGADTFLFDRTASTFQTRCSESIPILLSSRETASVVFDPSGLIHQSHVLESVVFFSSVARATSIEFRQSSGLLQTLCSESIGILDSAAGIKSIVFVSSFSFSPIDTSAPGSTWHDSQSAISIAFDLLTSILPNDFPEPVTLSSILPDPLSESAKTSSSLGSTESNVAHSYFSVTCSLSLHSHSDKISNILSQLADSDSTSIALIDLLSIQTASSWFLKYSTTTSRVATHIVGSILDSLHSLNILTAFPLSRIVIDSLFSPSFTFLFSTDSLESVVLPNFESTDSSQQTGSKSAFSRPDDESEQLQTITKLSDRIILSAGDIVRESPTANPITVYADGTTSVTNHFFRESTHPETDTVSPDRVIQSMNDISRESDTIEINLERNSSIDQPSNVKTIIDFSQDSSTLSNFISKPTISASDGGDAPSPFQMQSHPLSDRPESTIIRQQTVTIENPLISSAIVATFSVSITRSPNESTLLSSADSATNGMSGNSIAEAQSPTSSNAILIGILVGCILLILIVAIVLIVFVLRKRRLETSVDNFAEMDTEASDTDEFEGVFASNDVEPYSYVNPDTDGMFGNEGHAFAFDGEEDMIDQ